MAETAEEIYARANAAVGRDGRLAMPPVEEWDTFPFEGDMRVRVLLQPEADEPPRRGEDPADCYACGHGEHAAIWSDDHWLLVHLGKPSGLPVVVILEPRLHVDLGELPDELAGELGPLIVRIERAIRNVPGVGRVHVGRWGDGSYHFHLWFMARPARLPQLRSSFAAIWDDVLPPTPDDVWRENLSIVARALSATSGTAHV